MFYQGLTKTVMAGQFLAMVSFMLVGLALLVATILSFTGVLPWVELSVTFGGTTVPWAGAAL